MKILFTHGPSYISKSIMSVTGEFCSHVAIEIGDIVIHSNFRGLHIEWARRFRAKNTVVKELVPTRSIDYLSRVDNLLTKDQFSAYDFGAILFIGLSIIARDRVGIPLPKSNLWQVSGMYMCTELTSLL